MATFSHSTNPTPTSYLGPHFLGYSTSMEKLLLPQLPKLNETILSGTNGNSTARVISSSSSSSSPESNNNTTGNQQRIPSPEENATESNNTSTGEISDNSDNEETIDVVKSAFRQVKSNSRSHPYSSSGKDSGIIRTCRKSSPIKSVSENKKKQETVVISDCSTITTTTTTQTSTQPQKTVWRPY